MVDGASETYQVLITVTGEMVTSPEAALEKQQQIVTALGQVSGLAAEVKIFPIVPEVEATEEEAALYAQLEKPLDEVLPTIDYGKSPLAKILPRLQSYGLQTARDVLVVGSGAIQDIGNLGDKVVNGFRQFFDQLDADFSWPEEPSMNIISRVCRSLDEIPARAIGRYYPSMSVAQVLNLKKAERSVLGLESIFKGQPVMSKETAQMRYLETQEFAKNFMAARARYLRSRLEQLDNPS